MARPAPGLSTLPHAALGGSALSAAYAAGAPEALRLYPRSPWAAADRHAAAAEAAPSAAHRGAVADVLAEQNRAWGAGPDALALVDRLRQPDAAAVVTGQQLGLFAGPLYTVYKARTAVRLARRLAAETGRPVVPVFWLADEDHDFAEIHRATFVHGADVRHVVYDDGLPPDANRGPVGRLVLDADALAETLRQLAATLPPGPHRADVLDRARDAYRPGVPMRDAFARLLRAFVPEIVMMSADDARLKRLVAPLFQREVDSWAETQARLDARSAELAASGFHTQVAPTPVNLFWMAGLDAAGPRLPIDPIEGGFRLRGTADVISPEALQARIAAEPERVSPNVVLRPLVQDTLLPTAAYVAGPGEAAYYAQLGPVYEAFGVPMPVIEPRLSLTIVEPGVGKILDRYGLSVGNLRTPLDGHWRRLALDAADADPAPAFAAARVRAEAVLADLDALATGIDPSLTRAAGAARSHIAKALDRLETKTIRVVKRQHETVRERLERAYAALWPGGTLQERALCPLDVAARHGVDALAAFVDAVPLDASVHHVVRT